MCFFQLRIQSKKRQLQTSSLDQYMLANNLGAETNEPLTTEPVTIEQEETSHGNAAEPTENPLQIETTNALDALIAQNEAMAKKIRLIEGGNLGDFFQAFNAMTQSVTQHLAKSSQEMTALRSSVTALQTQMKTIDSKCDQVQHDVKQVSEVISKSTTCKPPTYVQDWLNSLPLRF